MSERPAVRSESRSVPSVLTAVPWVVVLLGVVLLTILLVLALLSFRGPEHQPAPASAPTLYLPTLPAVTVSASPTDEPLPGEAEPTPSPSSSRSPSPRASTSTATARPSDRPSDGPSDRPASVPSGELTARYQVTDNDRDSFEARLTVANNSGGDRNWRVELLFTGDIRSIRVSSTSRVSVSSEGNGWYALRGRRSLDPGESATVELTFGRTGSWDRPDQCTVNGADCVIG